MWTGAKGAPAHWLAPMRRPDGRLRGHEKYLHQPPMQLVKTRHSDLTREFRAIRVIDDLRLEDIDDRVRSGGLAARKALDRLLQRELAMAGDRARRRAETALASDHHRQGADCEWSLAKGVRRLLRSTSPKAGLAPSKRLTMPETGGRSFHFEHVSVRPDSCKLTKGQRLTGNHKVGKSKFAKDIEHTTRASTHQRYIVRDGAVERLADAATAQRYIDDELKVDPRLHGSNFGEEFSFGTPGLSVDDMYEMWELAEFHARGEKTPVIQHRMIVDLPHEATPQDRIAIMRAFVAPLEKAGIPYWVSIHAPTADNDERNFHAHVVFMNRPAEKILWPEGGDRDSGNKPDVMTWDFACVTAKQDKHRKTRDRYLQRQKVPPLLRGPWVKKWRHDYAAIVNDQMMKSGKAVRFDPRSYHDAGLIDVVPEKKAGYARKIVERHEPSLDDIISDLSRAAFKDAEAEFEAERRKLARAQAAAASGTSTFLDLLSDLHVIGEDDPIEKRERAMTAPSRRLARAYLASEEASLDLRVSADAERRLLRALGDATDAKVLAEARRRIAADMNSRTPDTRERSRAALAELPDDEAAQDLRRAVVLELQQIAALRTRQIEDARAQVIAASTAWLASLEPQAIVIPTPSRIPQTQHLAVITSKPTAPPVHAQMGSAALPSVFALPAPRDTIRPTPTAKPSIGVVNGMGGSAEPSIASPRAPEHPSEVKRSVTPGRPEASVEPRQSQAPAEPRSALHQEAIEVMRRAKDGNDQDQKRKVNERRRAGIVAQVKRGRGSDFGL